MRRLLATFAVVLLLLAALDRLVPLLVTPGAAVQSLNDERDVAFTHIVAMQFDELRANMRRLVYASHARWKLIPDHKRLDELRMFIIGNSAAMFSLVPRILEEHLGAAFPHRTVAVIPLILPGIRVADEQQLVRAALAKHADVIMLTPNLKDLVAGTSGVFSKDRELFGEDTDGRTATPATLVEHFLERHWYLYRERDELRTRFLGAAERLLSRGDASVERSRALQAAFAEIAAAATRGDMAELVETYRRHGMSALIATPSRQYLPEASPVFGTVTELAAAVRQGQAMGIAVFLPVNPIFRDAQTTAGFATMHVDDGYVRTLAARTLAVYGAAGFTTFDRVDALPASGFIDLVHVNADGMEAFTRDMAASLVEAIRPVADSTAAAGAPAVPQQ